MPARRKKISTGWLQMPLFHGILPLDRSRIWADLAAGMTLAAVGIPEVMGYTKIIQTPVITGLYTMFLPILAFAIFGSSRHLVVAADSATAVIVATALTSLAAPYSPRYVALTALVALMAGAMLLVARLLRLGFAGTIWQGVVPGRDRDQLLLTYLGSDFNRSHTVSWLVTVITTPRSSMCWKPVTPSMSAITSRSNLISSTSSGQTASAMLGIRW